MPVFVVLDFESQIFTYKNSQGKRKTGTGNFVFGLTIYTDYRGGPSLQNLTLEYYETGKLPVIEDMAVAGANPPELLACSTLPEMTAKVIQEL